MAPLVAGGPLCAWPLTVGRALPPFQLPILLKGTSDDDIPCPGYLFEEIASILPCGHMWGPWSRVPGLLP